MKFAIFKHKLISANQAKAHLIYRCPFCKKRLVCHSATSNHRAYFSHVMTANSFKNPGETVEHTIGKQQLARFFKTSGKAVTIEKYLPQINQWPDVMVDKMVIEFQCSPISSKRLKERISGYSKLGLKSWWILGHPYQKRHLRSEYLAKFMNYSIKIGFYIIFWETKYNRMKICYRISECRGRMSYNVRMIFNVEALRTFMKRSQLKLRPYNKIIFKRTVISEMGINQKRLFYGDAALTKLQQKIGHRSNTIMGCPIICHLPIYNLPIFRTRALLWHIEIIMLISQYSDFRYIYRRANSWLDLPLPFCQINHYQVLYQKAFIKYLRLLAFYKFIKIDFRHKKITKLKELRWFNSYYDKIKFLKLEH